MEKTSPAPSAQRKAGPRGPQAPSRSSRTPSMSADGSAAYEKVIQVNRCAKVVKGGKRFSFSALVVVGAGPASLGYAQGKANEVADAIRKALVAARKNIIKITTASLLFYYILFTLFLVAFVVYFS